jgi:hypothetical protein
MLRPVRLALALALLLALPGGRPSAGGAGPTRRALVVGIDEYIPPEGIPSGDRNWSNLEGSVNDALEIQRMLVDRFDFAPADIRLLRNAEAKRAAILGGLDGWLLGDARPGDVRVFFYAGHGSQVRNSKSREADKLDETIVPVDANRGVFDIRDKELAARFSAAVQRGVQLTVVLDSCHSGSAARGVQRSRARVVGNDARDVADPSNPPDPIALGALVLSAAQDFQVAYETVDDSGTKHGAFSLALIRALRTAPPQQSIETVFRSVVSMIAADGHEQLPVLGANEARAKRTFLGGLARAGRTRPVIAVESVRGWSEVHLRGGVADGLSPGCELVRPTKGSGRERLRVMEVLGLGTAVGQLIKGELVSLHAGDLFVLDRWVEPDRPALSVWAPEPMPPEQTAAAERAFERLTKSGWKVTDDPGDDPPTHVLTWTRGTWVLEGAGMATTLGSALDADKLARALNRTARDRAEVVLGVLWPPPRAVVERLDLGEGSKNPGISLERERSRAHYALLARRGAAEVAWVLLAPRSGKSRRLADLPVRSDWIPARPPGDAAGRLKDDALKLARVRGWLTLDPPEGQRFPYSLALVRISDGREVKDTDVTFDGERLKAVLRPDPSPDADPGQRYVYLFAVDSAGEGILIFPRGGGVENRFPIDPAETPHDQVLDDSLVIQAPFGLDHYYMLTSADALPDPDSFASSAVRARPGASSPLNRLLSRIGQAEPRPKVIAAGAKGIQLAEPVPITWSISRRRLESVAQPP